jgi:hypothetical protein
MPAETVSIARRYRGPLASGNGGYSAGLFARAAGLDPAEVTLRLPPPLDTPLRLTPADSGWSVLAGDDLVAEVRPSGPGLGFPHPPTWEVAAVAADGAANFDSPQFAQCFVCGSRPERDGLEIHAGPVAGRDGLVAAPWLACEVTPEIVWAAIDCPGAYAINAGERGEPVLARMTARIERLPREGERCVVVGWPLEEDGRKLHAGTALYGEDGEPVAIARQLWIEPRPA